MYACSICGSRQVVGDTWVDVNTHEIVGDIDKTFCLDCDSECDVMEETS
jgi:hypothetical protein